MSRDSVSTRDSRKQGVGGKRSQKLGQRGERIVAGKGTAIGGRSATDFLSTLLGPLGSVPAKALVQY